MSWRQKRSLTLNNFVKFNEKNQLKPLHGAVPIVRLDTCPTRQLFQLSLINTGVEKMNNI